VAAAQQQSRSVRRQARVGSMSGLTTLYDAEQEQAMKNRISTLSIPEDADCGQAGQEEPGQQLTDEARRKRARSRWRKIRLSIKFGAAANDIIKHSKKDCGVINPLNPWYLATSYFFSALIVYSIMTSTYRYLHRLALALLGTYTAWYSHCTRS
jgi:hypothetical protein